MHGYCIILILKMNIDDIRATKDFGSAVKLVMKDSHISFYKFSMMTKLSTRTLIKVTNNYEINVSRRLVYLVVLGLHQKFDISKALLQKAGITNCDTPVSKAYWEILKDIDKYICIANGEDYSTERINKALKKMGIPEKYRFNL